MKANFINYMLIDKYLSFLFYNNLKIKTYPYPHQHSSDIPFPYKYLSL